MKSYVILIDEILISKYLRHDPDVLRSYHTKQILNYYLHVKSQCNIFTSFLQHILCLYY
jgi:hypothetical protein